MPTKKRSGATNWVDPDDAPPLTEEHFQRADIYEGERLVRRGRPPLGSAAKVAVKLRLPRQVIDAFKADGPGWQTRISDTLAASAAGRASRDERQDQAAAIALPKRAPDAGKRSPASRPASNVPAPPGAVRAAKKPAARSRG